MALGGARPSAGSRALGLTVGMVILLAIQNLLGLWINLYVTVNDTSSYSGVFSAMFASAAGALHTLIGVFIGLNAILMVVLTWRLSDRRVRAIATVVLVLVAIAAYAGFHFVQSGGDNLYSFIMEASFAGTVLGETALLLLLARSHPPPWGTGLSPADLPAAGVDRGVSPMVGGKSSEEAAAN